MHLTPWDLARVSELIWYGKYTKPFFGTDTYTASDNALREKAFGYARLPDSGAKLTAGLKVNYDRDPDSGTKSTARSKANYDRDP